MKNRGWIKVYRDIQFSQLWLFEEPFDKRSAWIDMIMMANHEDKEVLLRTGKTVIKRGQFHTSIQKLANRWHWSVSRVRRYIELLDELTMIQTNGTACGTTVTIVKYDVFQDKRRTDDTTNDTANDTTGDTAGDTRTRMNKELLKNEKRKKEVIRTSFGFEAEE